jgi:uncharacterized protein (TIGR03086 family)
VTHHDVPAALERALDQLADLLDDVRSETLSEPTPCAAWTVQDLLDHIVAAPAKFARMVRGESTDWSTSPTTAGDDPAAAFRAHAEDLVRAGREHQGPPAPGGLDWQCAELAVHTWDLATAMHRSTRQLDPEVADRGLTFMRANLTEDNRSPAFAAEQPVPADADPYQRIAGFAGREV